MERKDLEAAAAHVTYLRGLLVTPIGMLFIVTGLGNLGWGPLRNPLVFVGSLLALGAAYLGINRYYNDHYGRVTRSNRQQLRYTLASFILFPAAMVGGPILDSSFDLPVSVFAGAFALAMLAWFAICVGLRARHLLIWGVLLVAGLLPVWGAVADKISVAWLPIGVATIVAGIFDHRALVRAYGPAKDLNPESSDVRA
jgi:hypothetical protein